MYIYSIGALHEMNNQKSSSSASNTENNASLFFIFFNWSITGCIMLCLLFQGSGYFTELITLKKYPKYYTKYMKHVPLYIPNMYQLLLVFGGNKKQQQKIDLWKKEVEDWKKE